MNIREFADKLFDRGKDLGFLDMEVYYINNDNFNVRVYERDIDSYKVNTEIGLSFRGIVDGKMGYSFTEKFEEEDIDFLLNSARQNAEQTQGDTEASIYEGSSDYAKLEGNKFFDEDVKVKIQDAMKMEEYALSKDERIKSVQSDMVASSKGRRRIINTKGLDLEEEYGNALAYISVVARDGEDVKDGDQFKVVRNYMDIDFSKVADEAIHKAISKLNAKSVPSGKYRIILEKDAATDLLSTFSSIFSGDSVQKGLSLLKGKLGQKVASELITIYDDPFYHEAPSNMSFDDEGVAVYTKPIIEKGILKTIMHNIKTARQSGCESTGNGFKASYKSAVAVSPSNMYIAPGRKSFEQAVKDEKKALIITELQGLHSGANPLSGDFSLAAAGYLVEDGKIAMPVEQITIAGNFYEVLKNVEEVLSDLTFGYPHVAGNYGCPTLVIGEMPISGK